MCLYLNHQVHYIWNILASSLCSIFFKKPMLFDLKELLQDLTSVSVRKFLYLPPDTHVASSLAFHRQLTVSEAMLVIRNRGKYYLVYCYNISLYDVAFEICLCILMFVFANGFNLILIP